MQPKKTTIDVPHTATLAHIPVSNEEIAELTKGFSKVLEVVDLLTTINTSGVEPVGQISGLENVTRTDEVQTERMFTQEEALRNAKRTYKGHFMVDQILDK